jgi:hypothetical protein
VDTRFWSTWWVHRVCAKTRITGRYGARTVSLAACGCWRFVLTVFAKKPLQFLEATRSPQLTRYINTIGGQTLARSVLSPSRPPPPPPDPALAAPSFPGPRPRSLRRRGRAPSRPRAVEATRRRGRAPSRPRPGFPADEPAAGHDLLPDEPAAGHDLLPAGCVELHRHGLRPRAPPPLATGSVRSWPFLYGSWSRFVDLGL